MLFGIYPGGLSGTDRGTTSGPPDRAGDIHAALNQLQGDAADFLVRGYCAFTDVGGVADTRSKAPIDVAQFASESKGRMLDLVIQYHSRAGDIAGYTEFVRAVIAEYGPLLHTVQIAEEPNVIGNPALDGDYPRVVDAVVEGVLAARRCAEKLGYPQLRVGTNTTPMFGPSAGFLREVTERGGTAFVDALDYVGLDMFPGVFKPIATEDYVEAVTGLLEYHRIEVLSPAGLGALPLRITENGWPTGPDRTALDQMRALTAIATAVLDCAERLNIECYELFSLRDADSNDADLFHQFGIMTSDYKRKPAFEPFRRLIAGYSEFEGKAETP